MPGEDLKVQRAESREVCPYCKDSLAEERTVCEGCGAGYHTDCWGELGGCGTVGCMRKAPVREASSGEAPSLREEVARRLRNRDSQQESWQILFFLLAIHALVAPLLIFDTETLQIIGVLVVGCLTLLGLGGYWLWEKNRDPS